MEISNLVLFTVGIINLFLAFFVYARNRKSKVNTYFAITIFGIALWCFSIAMFRMANLKTIYFWGQFVYFAINFTTIFFLFFTFYFPVGKFPTNKIIRFFLFGTPVLIFIITLIPRSIIAKASIVGSEITISVGWGYYIHSVLTALFFFWAFYNVITKFIKSSGLHRLQIWYLLLGTIISTVLGVITNIILFFWTTEYNWVGPSGTIIMIVFVAYAISRYRLMDVRLIIFRSLAFGLIVFVVGGIFAAISTMIASTFSDFAKIQSNIVSGVIVATLLTIFYQPLRKLIERSTNAFLYKKSYNPDILLNQITEVSSSILDLEQLLGSIAKSLDEAFHAQKLGIVLVDNEVKKLTVAHQFGFAAGVAQNLASYPNAVEILYQEVKRLGGLLVIDEMKTKYENGEFEPVDKELLLALYQNDIAVILPLHVKDQVVGIVVLGNKKSGDPYNSQDLNVLKIIAGQVAIAIENARLYDELKDFNVKLEEEVRRKTSQLRKANIELRRLDEAKSEFISIASHQLRTPLTVIKGYISMMQEGSFGEVPPKIMENLRKVYVSNERLIGLVENLLDISRIESGRQEFLWEKAQLEEIAESVVDNLKQTASDKGLNLILHKAKELTPLVLIDKNKIHEVVMNFIDNAIKYTPQGSIEVSISADKDSVKFCVKDSGKGIDEQIKGNLFKKFSRGKDSFRMHTEGVGLGLYVAKMIIDAHQGKIWAESEGVNKGSVFCFAVPLNFTPKVSQPKFGTKVR